jgi:glycyl-tRNA synthetase beta subunit
MPRDLINSEVRDFTEEQLSDTQERELSPAELSRYVDQSREYIVLKENKTALEKREAVLKKSLMELLAKFGQPTGSEGQHRTIEFPSPIRGVVAMVRQQRTAIHVDDAAAEAIARKHGLYDRLFKPVMTLDQDAVMVAVEEGRLTDEELERIFPKKVVHSFVMEKKK